MHLPLEIRPTWLERLNVVFFENHCLQEIKFLEKVVWQFGDIVAGEIDELEGRF